MERLYIIETLEKMNWVVGGRSGATAKLGMPRITLIARMRKLGIARAESSVMDAIARPRYPEAFAHAAGV